jgi:AcrR family transcriptional regulator
MPPKQSPRTDRIIGAAAQLFARQGYHATSTREIARLAEVSENTLFRHFEHKEDIFWSALHSHVDALRPRWELLGATQAGEAPEVALPRILELLAYTVNSRPDVLRLIAIAFLELPNRAEDLCRNLISPFFSGISRYLASSVEKGEVTGLDPTLLAASLMAMVLVHPQLSRILDSNSSTVKDSRGAVHAYSKFWLDVLGPRLSASSLPALGGTSQTSG